MGRACLRDYRHPWLARGPGSAAPRGWWQDQYRRQPDPARSHAYPKRDLCPDGGERLTLGERLGQRPSDAKPYTFAITVGVAVGDGGRERLGDPLPVHQPECVDISVSLDDRERETLL